VRKIDPVKHEQKRRDILEAAGRCFAKDGFRGASISSICSEAKISAGHLYHYFASKEAIIEAMAATGLEHAEERFNHLMKSDNPIEGLIAELEQASSQNCTTQQHQIDMRAKKQLHVDMLAEAGRNASADPVARAAVWLPINQDHPQSAAEHNAHTESDTHSDSRFSTAALGSPLAGSK